MENLSLRAGGHEWVYLAERPQSWKKQLFLKGRRLSAANVWLDMAANHMTREEAADDWDLPVEAIDEIVKYCEENIDLIRQEAEQEKQFLISRGVKLSP